MKKWIQRIVKLVIAAIVAYVILCTTLYFDQRNLLYHPSTVDYSSCANFKPEEHVTFGDVRLYTNTFVANNTRQILVYFYGNGESGCESPMWRDIANSDNMDYLIYEYPSYDNGTRETTRENVLSDIDTLAQHLANRSVIIIGRSLGNGPATYLAAKMNPQKIILISPYDRLSSVVDALYIPGFLLKDNFEPIEYLKSYNGTVIVFAGENDAQINYHISQRLNATKFILVTNAGHNDIVDKAYGQILSEIRN